MQERILVVGGNAAGMTAASRAKRLAPDLDITILEQSAYISYSICGVPFLLGWGDSQPSRLVSFDPTRLKAERDISALTRTRVEEILPARRRLLARRLESNDRLELDYEHLVLATGYLPRALDAKRAECENVFTISRLEDGLRLREFLEMRQVRSAAVVGAGYVGLMMTQALVQRGLEVQLWERSPQIFSSLDADMAEILADELQKRGVELHLNQQPRLEISGDRVSAILSGNQRRAAEIVLLDIGIRPNTWLAERAGIACGMSGAIQVDEKGRTSQAGILAAGNCAETRNLITGRPIASTIGTVAAQQGRVVGETLAGLNSRYPGSLETSIEQVFELGVSRTGLTLRQALQHGFRAQSVRVEGRTRAPYHPASASTTIKLVFECPRGRVLGAQIIGQESSAKRIDTLVVAISQGLTLKQIAQLDLAYSPSYSTLWDPIQVAANVGLRKLDGSI